jgi:hypothetical protein
MDVRLPDGTILKNVPDGTTKAQLTEKLAANGYDIGMLGPVETAATRENVGAELPRFARENPRLYELAVKARQLAGPTVEMLATAGGGALGAPLGPAGIVGGAGLGYGISKEALEAADVALGLKQPRTVNELITEPAMNVLTGATLEAGGRVAGPLIEKGLGALGRGATRVAGAVQDLRQLPNQFAAQIARKSFETPANLEAGRNVLRQAVDQGSRDTAAQALAQGGIISPTTQTTLSEAAKRSAPAAKATKEAAKEISRKSTLTLITPDIQNAVKLRAEAADPLYKIADESVAVVDDTLKSILDRMPAGTLNDAIEIAKIEGKPFTLGGEKGVSIGDNLTGQQMHYIKRALGDIAYGSKPSSNLGADAQKATRALLDEYLGAFESKIPEYGQARQIFSEMSAPINQAQVLKEMVSVLEKPGGGERIGPFLNVLGRGEQAMLKKAGGRGAPRFEALSEVLTPEQISAVRNVADSLKAGAEAAEQATLGQKRFADLVKEEIPNLRLPNVFSIFATTTNNALSRLDTLIGKKTMATLAKAAESAQSFDDLLATLPATERNKVLKVVRDPATWAPLSEKASKLLPKGARGGVIAGAASETPEMPVNALSPTQQNQNALAR